ncbi:MAG: NADH-quinone oxidoreductase subunit N [Chthonomonadaceae bacterium]|nr:NADH-quinone oxidoreductase subunit N [Chthonomonadaceae bacterium]
MPLPQQIPQIDWPIVMPVIWVTLTGLVALLAEMVWPKRSNNRIVLISLVGLFIAAWSVIKQFGLPEGQTFADFVLRDHLGLVLQLVLIGVCFVTFLFSESYLREKRIAYAEFYPLALWSTVGGMLMVSTTNLLELFLGLEVLSIALYCLAGMSRQESKSEESAIKYFLLGAFASAFLLLGIAYLFGATGSLDLRALGTVDLSTAHARTMVTFGLGMILVGLGFKSALVPFHQWTPDVYQGAPTNVTAFMASASKVAAFGALIRVLQAATMLQDVWFPAMVWICILTMSVANLAALVQKDVKRILGYSSIANAGYILVGLLSHLKDPAKVPLTTVLFYLVAYSAMTLGVFAVISLAASGGREGSRFRELHGLWKRAPFAVGCLIVFVASLVGVPPTAGFFGKLLIFNDALAAGLPLLAVVLAVNSVISVYYYLGIVQATFVDEEGAGANAAASPSFGSTVTVLVCVTAVIGIGLAVSPLQGWLGQEPAKSVEASIALPGSDIK